MATTTILALIGHGNLHRGKAVKHMSGPVNIKTMAEPGWCPSKAFNKSIEHTMLCPELNLCLLLELITVKDLLLHVIILLDTLVIILVRYVGF